MKNPKYILTSILFITLISLFISLPTVINLNIPHTKLHLKWDKQQFIPPFNKINFPLKTGLDIQGGSHLIYQADMSKINPEQRIDALASLKDTIERRVNLLGVSEAVIQTSNTDQQYRLIVELPGVTDITQATEVIGQTAQLQFKKPTPKYYDLQSDPTSDLLNTLTLDGSTDNANQTTQTNDPSQNIQDSLFTNTNLTGADLIKAQLDFDNKTGEPVVAIEFNSEGTKKFAKITSELVGKPLAIFLDNQLISSPIVNAPITGGQAIISGNFTSESAKHLSIQLNAGALPVPVKLISQTTVGATLGQDTIQKSLTAGLIGLGIVLIFMAIYYGQLGIIANIGLIIYGIITLALYKILGVTLTLSGIAGFILSVGMAVDANILIFERYKEETRRNRSPKLAIELAFGRAWDSIRDANICTLIATFILFNPINWSFLNTSGPVRGFALTLALGIFISLFTGIIVTRNLIRVFHIKSKPIQTPTQST